MCHVQQRACSISLYPHILRLCKSRQRTQGARTGDLGFVVFMRSQICDAPDGVALYFHIG